MQIYTTFFYCGVPILACLYEIICCRKHHCGFTGAMPMVCCAVGNTTNNNTQLEEETGFAVSDFDLRDGKQRFSDLFSL